MRVLRPGGRIDISDIVADDSLTPDQRAERGSYVGCIAGALSYAEHSVIAKATKPMTTASVTPIRAELPLANTGSGCGCGEGACC